MSPESLVPVGVRVAAGWAWRLLVITAAVALVGWAAWQLRVVVFPLVVAVLLATILAPAVIALRRRGWPRGLAAAATFVGFLLLVVGVLALAGGQIGGQLSQITTSAQAGLAEIQAWLSEGPLQLSQSQIDTLVEQARTSLPSGGDILGGALTTATAAAEVLAGLAIALFALFFFLYDGPAIWSWLVSLTPAPARSRADRAGRLAFATLVGYVRATLLVALFDAVFITIWLLVLQVPLAVPLGVLVFFGAFVPLIGAFVTGAAAVLVALVTKGLVVALLVLAGLIAVQQLEGHLFQPLVVGRLVQVHPLAVVVSISIGAVLAGIIGAIIAVPLVAVLNTVGKYLAGRLDPSRPAPETPGSAPG